MFENLKTVDQVKSSVYHHGPIFFRLSGRGYLIIGYDDDIQAFQTEGWNARLVSYAELQSALDKGETEILAETGD
jgi:hypothetical protein